MAEFLEGSEEAFVMKMNDKAKELGMNDTTFKNCHGIDEDGHETSPYDIALMSRELLTKHPTITKYTNVSAPITSGQKIGKVTYKSEGNILATVDLVANESIDKFGFGTMTNRLFLNWFSMLRD